MTKSKQDLNKLDSEDRELVQEYQEYYENPNKAIERAKVFKLGDYLVLYLQTRETMELKRNSYGAPVKYKVVYVTELGAPFMKRVNEKGNPVGRLQSCAGLMDDDYFRRDNDGGYINSFRFELDPDYADSLLLQSEYQPGQLHATKQEIWKAVTKHNKENKLKTDLASLTPFFDTVAVGDTLWTSVNRGLLIQNKQLVKKRDIFNGKIKCAYPSYFYPNWSDIRGSTVTVLTVLDPKGNTFNIFAHYFVGKALYKARPRSYNELKI